MGFDHTTIQHLVVEDVADDGFGVDGSPCYDFKPSLRKSPCLKP
jgi:hypothetical protein